MTQLLTRRLAGTAAAVLLTALVVLGFEWRYSPAADSYTVEVDFGRAGSGLTTMSDVKARGVRIGQVDSLAFENGRATGLIRLDGDVQLPAPQDLTVVVTAKTLLGEKQVEIDFPDDRFEQAPFLQPGDMVAAARQPTELNEVLDTLEPFLASIDGEDVATIIDALAAQEGEADVFAENLELTSELAQFARRTADQTLDNLDDLADVAAALRPTLDEDLDRIRASLPEATRVLREDPDEIETALVALEQFSTEFSELLEVEEDRIDRLFATGEPVGAMLERNASEVGSLLDGVANYVRILGGASGLLDDGTVFAYFRLFITEETQAGFLPEGFPPGGGS